MAGTGLVWRSVELAGVKSVFLVRLLILAWLLVPDDFGLFAIALTPVGFLLGVTELGMVPALVQRPEVENSHYNSAWTVGLIRATVITVVIVLGAPLIASIFAEPRSILVMRILAVLPVFEAASSIKLAKLIRELKFRPLAFVKLSGAFLNAIVAISLARSFGLWALVAGSLAGSAAHLLTSYILAPHRPRLVLDFASVRPLIRYGRWIFMTGLSVVLGGAVLKVVISRQLGAAELGLYFLAAKIAFLPLEMAGEVAGPVAFPLYARLQYDLDQVARVFRALLTGMAALLLPILGLMIALAPSLVDNVLSTRWAGVAPIIQVLAVASMIGLFGSATVPIFNGLGQPYKVLALKATQSLILIGLAWELAGRIGTIGVAIAWLPATLVAQIIALLLVVRLFHQPLKGLTIPTLVLLSITALGATVALIIDKSVPNISGFLAAGLIGMLVMVGVLWLSDGWFDLGLKEILARVFPGITSFVSA